MSCVVTESIGVYMLGAVDERERAAMGAHLEGCAACRAVADELRPVPVLLGRVHVDDLTPPEPSGHLLDRLLDARVVSRRRRRVGFMLAAAVLVAAAVVMAGAVGGRRRLRTPRTSRWARARSRRPRPIRASLLPPG